MRTIVMKRDVHEVELREVKNRHIQIISCDTLVKEVFGNSLEEVMIKMHTTLNYDIAGYKES